MPERIYNVVSGIHKGWVESNSAAVIAYLGANFSAWGASIAQAIPEWAPPIVTGITTTLGIVALVKNVQLRAAETEHEKAKAELVRAQTRKLDEEVNAQLAAITSDLCMAEKCLYRDFYNKFNPNTQHEEPDV